MRRQILRRSIQLQSLRVDGTKRSVGRLRGKSVWTGSRGSGDLCSVVEHLLSYGRLAGISEWFARAVSLGKIHTLFVNKHFSNRLSKFNSIIINRFPFIPYHFQLLQNTFNFIRRQSASNRVLYVSPKSKTEKKHSKKTTSEKAPPIIAYPKQ